MFYGLFEPVLNRLALFTAFVNKINKSYFDNFGTGGFMYLNESICFSW
jgi:hypothetical protein